MRTILILVAAAACSRTDTSELEAEVAAQRERVAALQARMDDLSTRSDRWQRNISVALLEGDVIAKNQDATSVHWWCNASSCDRRRDVCELRGGTCTGKRVAYCSAATSTKDGLGVACWMTLDSCRRYDNPDSCIGAE